MSEQDKITVWYDDDLYKIVSRFNKALEEYGLRLEEDGEEHDGFCVFNLKKDK